MYIYNSRAYRSRSENWNFFNYYDAIINRNSLFIQKLKMFLNFWHILPILIQIIIFQLWKILVTYFEKNNLVCPLTVQQCLKLNLLFAVVTDILYYLLVEQNKLS